MTDKFFEGLNSSQVFKICMLEAAVVICSIMVKDQDSVSCKPDINLASIIELECLYYGRNGFDLSLLQNALFALPDQR